MFFIRKRRRGEGGPTWTQHVLGRLHIVLMIEEYTGIVLAIKDEAENVGSRWHPIALDTGLAGLMGWHAVRCTRRSMVCCEMHPLLRECRMTPSWDALGRSFRAGR